MASALCERIMRLCPVGSRGKPLVRGLFSPETERHSLFRRPKDGKIWPTVEDFSVVLKLVQQSKCSFSIGTLT